MNDVVYAVLYSLAIIAGVVVFHVVKHMIWLAWHGTVHRAHVKKAIAEFDRRERSRLEMENL